MTRVTERIPKIPEGLFCLPEGLRIIPKIIRRLPKFNLPCGTNFCGGLFLRIDDFCGLRELIFAIRTDWFFLLGIKFFRFSESRVQMD